GAAEGRGLGLAFLRHLERCRVLCFVIDLSAGDPQEALSVLLAELRAFDPSLAERASIVAGNKVDLPEARARLSEAARAAGGRSLLAVSALNGEGIEALADALGAAVATSRIGDDANEQPSILRIRPDAVTVEVLRENGAYRVRNSNAERLVARFDLTNADAVRYVQERLVGLGVED